MDVLKLCLVSVFSIIVLFLLTKIMGNKQVSELSMFDYIIGISIGSIAAEMATELESFWRPLLSMVIYAFTALGFSVLCSKSARFRRIGFGKTLLLFYNGTVYRENLKKAKLDINEVLVECRSQGFFDLCDLKAILFEPNGKLSFLPSSSARPLNPSDMGLAVKDDNLLANVIIDGKIMERNLKSTGHDENWLKAKLSEQNAKLSEVFLATCDRETLNIYKSDNTPKTADMFE